MNYKHYTAEFYNSSDEITQKAIVDENVSRAKNGASEWNTWASEMESIIKEKGGTFGISFEHAIFPDPVDFSEFRFPGIVSFSGARFNGTANFSRSKFLRQVFFFDPEHSREEATSSVSFCDDVNFSNAEFHDQVFFIGVEFDKSAIFDKAVFKSDTHFSETTFTLRDSWEDACFEGPAFFTNASFSGLTSFKRAVFQDSAFFSDMHFQRSTKFDQIEFNDARFKGSALFQNAHFGPYVRFDNVLFSGSTWFHNAHFDRRAIFNRAKFKDFPIFDGAIFSELPNFLAVSFSEPPSFSQVKLHYHFATSFFGKLLGFPEKPSDVQHYRRLKGFAIDSHDHEQEIYFFSLEQRAKRGVEVKGLSIVPGLLYDWSSDFGRSLIRPFVAFLITIILFMTIQLYIIMDAPKSSLTCTVSHRAAYVTYVLSNSFPILMNDRATKQTIRECLFHHGAMTPSAIYTSSIQSMFSAVFIFLFGLGLRNRFRIK